VSAASPDREVGTSGAPIVSLENFGFTYPNAAAPALSRISLSVAPGEFVGITGEEGSGRTTLFRALNGSAVRHYKGSRTGQAIIGGLDACTAGHATIGAFTASIFDDPDSQIVSLTAGEEVGFSLAQRGFSQAAIRERVEKALAEVGLSGFSRRSTSSLSGGQKQRLIAAAALALEPTLILLDESTSALDPRGKREFYDLLDRLRRENNVAIIAIERDLELLMERADRIVVLHEGYVLLDGKPRDMASSRHILRTAGLRLPAWMETVEILKSQGWLEGKAPESEAEAVALIAELLESVEGAMAS